MRLRTSAMAGLLALALAATASAPASAQSKAPAGGGADAAKALAAAYVKAVMAGDAKAVAALYTENAINMPPNQPPIKGRAAIQQYYEKLLGSGTKMARFTITHIDSRTMGDRGYDVGTYDQSMTPAGGTASEEDTGKYVVILERVGSDWKVAYAIFNSDKAPRH